MTAAIGIESPRARNDVAALSGIDLLLFAAALTQPFLPKLGLAPGVYANVIDLVLLLVFPLFLYFDRYLVGLPSQRYLLAMWLMMVGFAGLYFVLGQSPSVGILKLGKRILYIPLVYVGYKVYRHRTPALMARIGTVAILMNILIFVIVVWGFHFNPAALWENSLVFGGLSDRYLDLKTFQIDTVPAGAHGVWGTYCALVFVLALYARRVALIGRTAFLLMMAITLFSIALTPSREALLLILIFLLLAAFRSIDFSRAGFGRDARLVAAAATIVLSAAVLFVGQLPIVEKLQYTTTAFERHGTEGNIQERIRIWEDTLASMAANPVFLIGGVGSDAQSFRTAVEGLDFGAQERLPLSYYGDVFESVPVEALAFGGIFTLGLTIAFAVHLWRLSGRQPKNRLFAYFRMFLVGMFITNTFSGAAIFADETYAWFLLLIGFLYRIDAEAAATQDKRRVV